MFRRVLGTPLRSQIRLCSSRTEQSFIISNEGDSGTSKVLSGHQLKKSHPLMHAIGQTEELNAQIGMARVFARDAKHDYVEHLKRVQTVLIDITNTISKSDKQGVGVSELDVHTKEMEEWIQQYATKVEAEAVDDPSFIVPGGSQASAALQISRAICRRVERTAVGLVDEKVLNSDVQKYLNRLGDFLLILSRIATKLDERTELVYIPKPDPKAT